MNSNGPSRRHWLTLALAAAASGSSARAAEPGPSLTRLARAKGLRFGSAVGAGPAGTLIGSFDDARYRAVILAECGMIVPENELKWYALRRDPVAFDFRGADRLAAFAAEHDLAFRGHTLVWHHPRWFPDWVATHDFGPRPAVAAEAMIREHIARVCGRYPQIDSWDVVNETIDDTTGAPRETVFSKILGQSVLDIAFHAAREAAPRATLVYNDYMSWEAGTENHRAGVLRLLEGFRARNVPIDALGVQSHIGTANTDGSVGFDTRQAREWRRFMDEVTGMGYGVLITEFDVHDKGLPADIAVRDQAVADYAKAYLDLMLSYRQVKDVLAWSMVDSYSWLQGLWPRPDGLAKRPTPYDAQFRAKPLRQAIAAALRGAPAR